MEKHRFGFTRAITVSAIGLGRLVITRSCGSWASGGEPVWLVNPWCQCSGAEVARDGQLARCAGVEEAVQHRDGQTCVLFFSYV